MVSRGFICLFASDIATCVNHCCCSGRFFYTVTSVASCKWSTTRTATCFSAAPRIVSLTFGSRRMVSDWVASLTRAVRCGSWTRVMIRVSLSQQALTVLPRSGTSRLAARWPRWKAVRHTTPFVRLVSVFLHRCSSSRLIVRSASGATCVCMTSETRRK